MRRMTARWKGMSVMLAGIGVTDSADDYSMSITNSDGTTPARAEGVDTPKATPWPLFCTATTLYVAGAGGVSVGLHFNNGALVVASVVSLAISCGVLIVLHGRLH